MQGIGSVEVTHKIPGCLSRARAAPWTGDAEREVVGSMLTRSTPGFPATSHDTIPAELHFKPHTGHLNQNFHFQPSDATGFSSAARVPLCH